MMEKKQSQVPPEDAAYQGEDIDRELQGYETMLRRTKQEEPDPQLFEYQGRVEFDPPEKAISTGFSVSYIRSVLMRFSRPQLMKALAIQEFRSPPSASNASN